MSLLTALPRPCDFALDPTNRRGSRDERATECPRAPGIGSRPISAALFSSVSGPRLERPPWFPHRPSGPSSALQPPPRTSLPPRLADPAPYRPASPTPPRPLACRPQPSPGPRPLAPLPDPPPGPRPEPGAPGLATRDLLSWENPLHVSYAIRTRRVKEGNIFTLRLEHHTTLPIYPGMCKRDTERELFLRTYNHRRR